MDQDAAVESEDGDQDTCSFSKSEAELLGTFTSSSMTREDGDRLMQWASNKCFKGEDVQPVKIRTLIDSVAKKYAPEGVKRADFTEEMDGDQRIFFITGICSPVLSICSNTPVSRLVSTPNFVWSGMRRVIVSMAPSTQGIGTGLLK